MGVPEICNNEQQFLYLRWKLQVELSFLGKVWDVTQNPTSLTLFFFPPVFNHVFFWFFLRVFSVNPKQRVFFYSFETPPPQKKNTTPNSTVDPAVESFFWLRDLQRRPLWSLRTKNWSKGAMSVVAFVGFEHLELLATRNPSEVSMVIKSL